MKSVCILFKQAAEHTQTVCPSYTRATTRSKKRGGQKWNTPEIPPTRPYNAVPCHLPLGEKEEVGRDAKESHRLLPTEMLPEEFQDQPH